MLSLVIIAVVAGATIAATRAFFTSQDVLGTNTLSSGTLSLDLNGAETKIIGLGNVTGLVPGMSTPEGTIIVNNVGTENFAWVGKFLLSGDSQLPKIIYIKDMKMEFLKPDTTTWEPSDHFIKDGKGYGSWPTYYNSLAASDPLGVISLKTWNENYSGMIPPYPFFEGALKPGYQYKLTFTLAMHTSATNTYMGRTMGLGFQANATQINAEAVADMISGLIGATYPASSVDMTWLNAQIAKQVL